MEKRRSLKNNTKNYGKYLNHNIYNYTLLEYLNSFDQLCLTLFMVPNYFGCLDRKDLYIGLIYYGFPIIKTLSIFLGACFKIR